MFRVLLPQVVGPFALDGLGRATHLHAVVLQCHSPERIIELDELLLDLVDFHVAEGLVLHIAVDVGGRHVRVLAAAHVDLELKVLVGGDKVGKFSGLEEVANAEGGAPEVAEIKTDVFKLVDASANHDLFNIIDDNYIKQFITINKNE